MCQYPHHVSSCNVHLNATHFIRHDILPSLMLPSLGTSGEQSSMLSKNTRIIPG